MDTATANVEWPIADINTDPQAWQHSLVIRRDWLLIIHPSGGKLITLAPIRDRKAAVCPHRNTWVSQIEICFPCLHSFL